MHNNLVRNQSPVILLKASKNTSVTFYFDVGPWWTVLRASSVLGYLLRSYQWTSVADSEDEITLSRSRALFGWRSLTSRELSTRTGVSSLVYCSLSALHWLRQDSAYTYTDIMVTYCCQLLPTAVTDSTQTLPSQALHRHCRHRLNKDTAVTDSTQTLPSHTLHRYCHHRLKTDTVVTGSIQTPPSQAQHRHRRHRLNTDTALTGSKQTLSSQAQYRHCRHRLNTDATVTDSTQTLPSQAQHRHCRHRLNTDTAVTGSIQTLPSQAQHRHRRHRLNTATAVTGSTQTLPSQAQYRRHRHRLNTDTVVTGSTKTPPSQAQHGHWVLCIDKGSFFYDSSHMKTLMFRKWVVV